MAEVWMGRQVAIGGVTSAVAVKLIRGDFSDDPHYRRMFVAEARISALLRHQNIVRVQNVGEEEGELYLVMDWVDGMNLSQLAALMRDAGQPMPLVVIGFVVGELLRGLAYAHRVTHEGAPLGVVHRDVSPQNVLISVSGEVMLADFGVARLADDETSHTHTARGKVRYMSPEQLGGLEGYKAPTVDLYAVGGILHELLEGQKFRRTNEEKALANQVYAGIIPTLDSVHDVPPELDALRLALLQPDPGGRPPSASEALKMLARWPGYRNAAEELGALCGSFMGVEAPRSGIHDPLLPSSSASVPDVRVTDAVAVDLPTRTSAGAASAAPEDSADARRRSKGGLLVVLAAAAVTVVGVGLASWMGAGDGAGEGTVAAAEGMPAEGGPQAEVEPERPAVTARPPGAAVPPTEPAGDEAPAAPEPGVAESEDASPRPGPESDPPPATKPARRRSPSPARERTPERPKEAAPSPAPRREKLAPPKAELVSIPFSLKGPSFAFVRVDRGKAVALEPRRTLELPAGRHRIEWGTTADGPWKDAGYFDLRAGDKIRVTAHGPKKF